MNKLIITAFCVLFMLLSCKKEEPYPKDIPTWLKYKIDVYIESSEATEDGYGLRTIDEYVRNDTTTFWISNDGDGGSYLYYHEIFDYYGNRVCVYTEFDSICGELGELNMQDFVFVRRLWKGVI